MPEHKHEIDWVCEGPTWFCKCGAEFYPRIRNVPRPLLVSSMRPTRPRIRIRLSTIERARRAILAKSQDHPTPGAPR